MRLIREIQAHAASESAEFGFSESQNLFKETEVAPREVVLDETGQSEPSPPRIDIRLYQAMSPAHWAAWLSKLFQPLRKSI